jgi:hypothetical protein
MVSRSPSRYSKYVYVTYACNRLKNRLQPLTIGSGPAISLQCFRHPLCNVQWSFAFLLFPSSPLIVLHVQREPYSEPSGHRALAHVLARPGRV